MISVIFEHFLELLEVVFEVFVAFVLAFDGLDVSDVSDSPVVVGLEFFLVGFDLYPQLFPFFFYPGYFSFYFLLRHLLSTFSVQVLFDLFVVNIQRSEGLLFVVVWQSIKQGFEIIVITSQLVLHLLLLSRQSLQFHCVNKLLKLGPSVRLEQGFFNPNSLY